MTDKLSPKQRREIERAANVIRFDGIRKGLATEEVAERIIRNVPNVLPLEAWRFAHGWTRAEVSARIDSLYVLDGLQPPNIDNSRICRWEHGERRPNEERIEYFCRLYKTRPDQLGFGNDHTPGKTGHVQRTGIIDAFPYTGEESEIDLIERISSAQSRINLFGLTRNYYAEPRMQRVLEEKVSRVPITMYLMDPHCESRRDRYRIEPAEAAMENPDRFVREVLRPLHEISLRSPKLRVFLYNFPCSYAIEEIDDACRVMLYGHGKRGTQAPIVIFGDDSSSHTYFTDQIRWLERLSEGDTPEPWASKGIIVKKFEP